MKVKSMCKMGQGIALSVVVGGMTVCSTWAVELGDTVKEVKAELGKPSSSIQIGERQVLYYDRGRIEAVDDAVVEVDLVSQEEADAARRLREEVRARMEQEQREKALARHAEGVTLRDTKLSDVAFMHASASRRVSFWRSFKSRYPDVELGVEYEEALRELYVERQAQRKETQEQARLRDLEQRVLEAEDRAARAEQRAYDEARRRDRNRYTSYSYPSVYVYNDVGRFPSREEESCYESPGVVLSRGNHIGIKNRSSAVSPKPGYIRPKGSHNANVHNRALRPYPYPTATYIPYESRGAYGFQRAAPSFSGSPGTQAQATFGHSGVSVSGRYRSH